MKSLEGIYHHKNTNDTNKFKSLYEIPWTFILIHRKYIFKAGKRRWKLLLATKRLHLVGKGDGNIRCTLQPMWKSIYLCESLKDSHEGYINVMINLISRLTWKLTQSLITTTGTRGQGKFVKVQIVIFLDKPAHPTIRVLLIVKSDVKNQIGRRWHCLIFPPFVGHFLPIFMCSLPIALLIWNQ